MTRIVLPTSPNPDQFKDAKAWQKAMETWGNDVKGKLETYSRAISLSLDSTPIGVNDPSTGAFTTLSAISLSATSINTTPIGLTTPSTGAFTTLSASTSLTVTDPTNGLTGIRYTGTGTSGANIKITGNGVSTPSKTIRVYNGTLQVLNHAQNVVLAQLTDAAVFSIATVVPTNITGTTTNNSATAGSVGEYISSTVLVGSAVSLTSLTDANVTSISLTAGDWDVWGVVATDPAGTTVVSQVISTIHTVSATRPTIPNGGAYALVFPSSTASAVTILPTGTIRYSLSGTTTIYLVTLVQFTTSTCGAYGFLGARRVR